MSIFEWSFKIGFTVTKNPILAAPSCTHMPICIHVGRPLGVIILKCKISYDQTSGWHGTKFAWNRFL